MQAGTEALGGDGGQPPWPVCQLPQHGRIGDPPGRRPNGFVLLQCRGHGIAEGAGQCRQHRADHSGPGPSERSAETSVRCAETSVRCAGSPSMDRSRWWAGLAENSMVDLPFCG